MLRPRARDTVCYASRLGAGIQDVTFRISGLGFRVSGVKLRVEPCEMRPRSCAEAPLGPAPCSAAARCAPSPGGTTTLPLTSLSSLEEGEEARWRERALRSCAACRGSTAPCGDARVADARCDRSHACTSREPASAPRRGTAFARFAEACAPGLGFTVYGSGFRVQGSGFRVQGLGFRKNRTKPPGRG